MANIYVGQTALEIRLNLFEDLTNTVERVLIKYRKPNGLEGFWPAEIIDPVNGVISYTFPTSSSGPDDEGIWTVWAFLYYKDGSVIPGDPVQFGVYSQGKSYIAFPFGRSSIGGPLQMAQEAFEIIYNNTGSGMVAANVQDAIDELDAKVDTFESPAPTSITYDNTGSGLAATDVQEAIDEIGLLISQVSKTIYVDKSRTDIYVEDGTIHRPYKTLAMGVSSATDKAVIKVSSDTYTENIALAVNVSLVGMGIGKTILTGTVSTGASGNCTLRDMTVNNNITILNDTAVYDVVCTGSVTTASNVKGYNFNIASSVNHALAVSSGLVILDKSILSTTANSPAVVHNGGTLVLQNADVQNNSASNAAVDSSGGAIRIIESFLRNLGGGLAADLDNGATSGAPNVLSNVTHTGGISTGTAYTVQEGIHGAEPTGTAFARRPATQIGFNNVASGLTATQMQAALDEAYSSSKSGTADPVYTPTRIPEFFVRTDTNVLWIYTGTWHFVALT
jgi:hypothetical protein